MKKLITLAISSLIILPIALFPGIAQARGFSHSFRSSYHSSFHSSHFSSYHYNIKPTYVFKLHHAKVKKRKIYVAGGSYYFY